MAVFVIDDPTVAVAFVAVVFDGSAYQFEFIKYSTVATTKTNSKNSNNIN